MTNEDWAELAQKLIDAVNDNGPNAAEIWSAVAAWLTLLVAGGALYYAKGQLAEASQARNQTKRLELEKSQPYVVMSMEESLRPERQDIVVRNYGQTVAYDVKIELDPRPKRSHENEDVEIPEVIPFLAPGQEWRTHWDDGRERLKSKLPDRHEGVVRYLGIDKVAMSSESILDWKIYKSRIWTNIYGMHDLASAVMEMQQTHKRWNESIAGGLRVYSRDGDAKDAAFADAVRQHREETAEQPAPSKRVPPEERPSGTTEE